MLAFGTLCGEKDQCDWLLDVLLWFWAAVLAVSVVLALTGAAAGWVVARRRGLGRGAATGWAAAGSAGAAGVPWLVATTWSIEVAVWTAGAALVSCVAAVVLSGRKAARGS